MTEPVTEAGRLLNGYLSPEEHDMLIEAEAEARADALTMTIDGKPAGMIDPEEWVKRALAAEQARADANAEIERLRGIEKAAQAVVDAVNERHDSVQGRDKSGWKYGTPYGAITALMEALSATSQPDSEEMP